jgi:hypothetical protein
MQDLYTSLGVILARAVPQSECDSSEQHRGIDQYTAEVLTALAHDALEALDGAPTTGKGSQRRLLKGMSEESNKLEQLVQGVLKVAIRGIEHYLKAPLPPRERYFFSCILPTEEQVGIIQAVLGICTRSTRFLPPLA